MLLRTLSITCLFVFALGDIAAAQEKSGEWEFPAEWFYHKEDAQRAKHTPLLGKPMPRLSLADWQNGMLKPADMKGKILVLDFWATWCGPCIKSIPHNNEMYAKYKEESEKVKSVTFLGRLAQYRYYTMGQTVARSLTTFKQLAT